MAQAFSPRFVDLVRNTTTTVGTGNFVLGPAVAGFTGFASAIQPGESFYYSCVGVAKPDESEVGRGTMQADGTISRDPVNGTLTDFTTGPKNIALIAAAEWFEKVDRAGGGASPIEVADRAALAAQSGGVRLLFERGREGMFRFEPGDLSAMVAADPLQGVYVAKASDPSGASGGWVRLRENDHLTPDWFGAAGDGATDDTAAFVAMRTLGIALSTDRASGLARGPEIRLGPKDYLLASSFDCKGFAALWSGCGGGYEHWENTSRTTIRMAAGATWYFCASNTEGNTTGTAISAYSSHGSVYRNITWRGPGKGVGGANLCHAKVPVYAYDCRFIHGGNHGLAITGTIGGGGSAEGNANCWQLFNCHFSQNGGSGLYTNGADANAGTAFGCTFNGNARYGTEEESFLGNSYYGCHWNANTLGHLHGTNPNNTSRFGDYFESGYPMSTVPPRSVSFGTNASNQIAGANIGANDATGSGAGVLAVNGLQILKSGSGKTFVSTAAAQTPTIAGEKWSYTDFSGGGGSICRRFRTGADIFVEELNAASTLYLRAVNGNGTGGLVRHSFGRATPPTGYQGFSNFVLGNEGFNPDGKVFVYADAVPTGGDVGKGEIRFNTGASSSNWWAAWCSAGHASSGGSWDRIYRRLYGAATYDPPSIPAGSSSTTTVTVAGAAAGPPRDIVTAVDFGTSIHPLTCNAWVSGADTVTVSLSNAGAAAADLGPLSIRVEVTKQ